MINTLYDILDSIPIKYVWIGYQEFTVFSKDELNNGRIRFRIDAEGNTIESWNDKWYVIGVDGVCGDPIIVDLSKEQPCILYVIHDYWDEHIEIAASIKTFI